MPFSLPLSTTQVANVIVLGAKVGRGGINRPEEVRRIQDRLNRLSPPARGRLKVDGLSGPNTVGAIKAFQRAVLGFNNPDGRVDPGGKTLAALNDPGSAAKWARRQAQGTGNAGPGVPEARTGDDGSTSLLDNPATLQMLRQHLFGREGFVDGFYCDSKGLVTIGYGMLIEVRSRSNAEGKRLARALVGNPYRFRHRDTGAIATKDEVAEDWQRVHDSGDGAQDTKGPGLLKVTQAEALRHKMDKIHVFTRAMHRHKPFSRRLDPLIQAALVDVRWNSSGVNPFAPAHAAETDPLWNKLDPEAMDAPGALKLFRDIWDKASIKSDTRPTYWRRHLKRCEWMRLGLTRMTEVELAPVRA